MKRSHSPSTAAPDIASEEERHAKVHVMSREFEDSQRIINQLEKEIEVLQKEKKVRDVAMKKAEKDLHRKQRELDESIEEVMNWIPNAIADAHDKRDSTYRLLRKANLQLMECQKKLKIPISTSFVDEDKPVKNKTDRECTDTSLMLGRELIKSKELYTKQIAALNEKVASLEGKLADLQAVHASCNKNKMDESGSIHKDDQTHECKDALKQSVSGQIIETNSSNEDCVIEADKRPLLDHPDSIPGELLPIVTGPTMYPLLFPQGAIKASWFKSAFEFVNVNLGGPYTALVSSWITLEQINKWQTRRTGLAKFQRPAELTTWVSHGRYEKKKIVIEPENVDQFGQSVWAWWIALQPKWRQSGPDGRPLPVGEFKDDWDSLDHYGTNGWLGILACIKWWGECLALMKNDNPRKERVGNWLVAVTDATKMLEGLILYKQRYNTQN